MKKIVALVLSLVMVLGAVGALAADSPTPSKKTYNYASVTTPVTEVTVGKVADTDGTTAIKELLKEGAAAGDPLSLLPDDVKSQIPADFKKVNEMSTYKLSGDVTSASSVTLTFAFETKYAEGEEVKVLLGISKADGTTEWIVLTGKGNKAGAVEVELDKATLAKIGNNPFVVIPVSK